VTIEASMPSEIDAISPLMDQLVRLIEGSCCITGSEFAVELALREALNNAVVQGNAIDPHSLLSFAAAANPDRDSGSRLPTKEKDSTRVHLSIH
jgi:hypothetical protein